MLVSFVACSHARWRIDTRLRELFCCLRAFCKYCTSFCDAYSWTIHLFVAKSLLRMTKSCFSFSSSFGSTQFLPTHTGSSILMSLFYHNSLSLIWKKNSSFLMLCFSWILLFGNFVADHIFFHFSGLLLLKVNSFCLSCTLGFLPPWCTSCFELSLLVHKGVGVYIYSHGLEPVFCWGFASNSIMDVLAAIFTRHVQPMLLAVYAKTPSPLPNAWFS
jgi:hypothetical protein